VLGFLSNSYWCLTFVNRVEGWKMHHFHVPSIRYGSKIHGLISPKVCIIIFNYKFDFAQLLFLCNNQMLNDVSWSI